MSKKRIWHYFFIAACVLLVFVAGTTMLLLPTITLGEPSASDSATTEQSNTKENTYMINTNTKVFHHLLCSYAKRIHEKNKRIFTGDRAYLIVKGYSACGHCHP